MSQHEGRNDRLRRQLRERRNQFNADSARAFNPQGTALTGPSVAFAAPPELPKVGWARMFLNDFASSLPVVGDILGAVAQTPAGDILEANARGAARGIVGGFDAGLESLMSIEGQVLKSTGVGEFFGGEAFLDWFAQDADDRNVIHIGKDRIAAPESIIGSLTEGIFQAGIGLLGVGKVMAGARLARGALTAATAGTKAGTALTLGKGINASLTRIGTTTVGKWSSKALRFIRGAGKGSLVGAGIDAAFFDPNENRLANLIADSPEWFGSALTDYLAETDAVQFLQAKPEDSEALGRFKNTVEGLILGSAFGTVVHAANVSKLRWMGKKAEAADLAARFMPQEAAGIVELPNGKFRLSQGAGDTKAMLTEFFSEGSADVAKQLEGLDVIHDPNAQTFRVFLFDTPEGPGAIGGVVRDGRWDVERFGRWDAEAEQIIIHRGDTAPMKPGERGPDAFEAAVKAESPQQIEQLLKQDPDMTRAKATGLVEASIAQRREFVIESQLDETFQNSITDDRMMTLGAEIYSYMPQISHIDGFRLKSGKEFSYPVSRLRQEIFTSRGDAGIESLSATDGRNMRNAPIDKLNAEQFTEMEAIKDLYKTNRSEPTIRKAEQKWVARNRTNMATGAEQMVALVGDMARVLETAGSGSRQVMIRRGDNALQLLKKSEMAGLLNHPELAKINPIAVRRAAGLMMESLASDVVRYTRRTQQGGSNLSYLQLGRALDQMMHVEEMLTGRPAIWFDKHKRLFDDGAFGHGPEGKVSNAEMAQTGETVRDAPVRDPDAEVRGDDDLGQDDGGSGPTEEAKALEREGLEERAEEGGHLPGDEVTPEGRRLRQEEFDQPGGANDPLGPPAPPSHMLAGVAPGPKSLRNLSKTELQRLGTFIALADGEPHGMMVALKAARLEAASTGRGGGWRSTLLRYRIAAMLSGYSTQAVNIVSTGIQTALRPAELMVAGALSGQPKYIVQGAHQLSGMVLEMGDAWRASVRAYKAGKGSLDPSFMTREVDGGRFEGPLAFANVPQDFLTSADEFYKVLNYRGRIRAKTMTQAGIDGLDHRQTAQRVNDALEASQTADGVGLNTDALEYSRNTTFTDALGKKAASISGLLRGNDLLGTAGTLWVPFIRTPHNIAANILVRSPLAMANMKAHRAAIQQGGEVAAERLGRMATAAAMVGTAGLLVESGRIQGRGPMNPATRAAWKAAGFEPFTITYGDNKKFHYNKLSSYFGPLAMVADMWYVAGNMKSPQQAYEGLMQVTASLMSYVSDQGFVGNAGEMFDAILSGDGQKLEDFASSVALGMIVPKAVSQLTAMDDQMREAEGFIDNLFALTPGLSETLPPERNIFREPIFKAPGSWDRLLNPFTSVGKTDTKVAMALFRVGRHMSLPDSKKFGGRIDLKDTDRWGEVQGMSPYEYWMEKTAKMNDFSPTLKKQLTDLIRSPLWASMPEGSEDWPGGPRYEEVARIVTLAQELGWLETLNAFPDLMTADINEKMLKLMGRIGGEPATTQLQQSISPPPKLDF